MTRRRSASNAGRHRHFAASDLAGQSWVAEGATAQVSVVRDRVYAGMRRLASVIEPGTRSLPQTLDALVRCAVEATGAAAGAIYGLDADRSLFLMAGLGLDATSGVPEAASAAVAARGTFESGDPARTEPDPTQGDDTAPLCVPLLSAAEVLGVLCCHCPDGSRPGQLELSYLSLVAAQASSTLDSARARETAAGEAAVSERRRLARELHDSVSQSLYSIGLGARTARELLHRDPALAHQPIDHVLRLAETGLVEMRTLIFEPAPDGPERVGLVAALNQQIAAVGLRQGVATHTALGPEPPVGTDVKQALFRIAREALQNVTRHARAGHITARLDGTPTDLTLEIADDGVGFDATASFPGHLGLVSMHERIAEVGGDLDISSTPGRGTRIRASAPVRH